MFIQTESTPNPLTLKFMPGTIVMGGDETAFFTTAKAAGRSPLATTLFAIDGVNAIFLGYDFITVTRAEDSSWEVLKPSLLTAIMEHFVAGKPVINQSEPTDNDQIKNEDQNPLVQQIKELIDTRVRPAVAMDGGDIIFHSFDESTGIVQLEMHGACSGCPSSTATLKQGIENMLKHYVPEVQAVEPVM